MSEKIANPNPSPVQVIGRVSECMRRLMEMGLSYEDLQKPITNSEFRRCLVLFWKSFVPKVTVEQRIARKIMGKNFFGPYDACLYFGLKLDDMSLVRFAEDKIPFSEATLQECKDTHILVANFGLPIFGIKDRVAIKGLFFNQDWYDKQAFTKGWGKVSWQLVRKTPADNSISKNWIEQQALLGQDDEIPNAQVMVYAIIGHYLATSERLFKNAEVRTSSVDSNGLHISVGFDNSGSFFISYCGDEFRHNGNSGVASARKPDNKAGLTAE